MNSMPGKNTQLCFQLPTFLFVSFFCLRWRYPPLYPAILQHNTMILHLNRIIVGDVGFEPETSAPKVWCATNESPHLQPKSPHWGRPMMCERSLFCTIWPTQRLAHEIGMEVLVLQGLLHHGHGLQEDEGVEEAVEANNVGSSFSHPVVSKETFGL